MTERILLKVNQQAPTFDVIDIFDRRVRLTDYLGKRLFIGFFRHAGCPFCNVRVHKLEAKHEELKALDMEMIFFFESDRKTLLGNNFHKTISPIPVIADPEKKWYGAYGIENSLSKSIKSHATTFFSNSVRALLNGLPVHYMAGKESFSTIPAEFLVDEFGVVRRLHYAKSLTDQTSTDLILRFAKHNK